MVRRILAMAALAVLSSLLVAEPAVGQQGWPLQGGAGSSSRGYGNYYPGPSYYPRGPAVTAPQAGSYGNLNTEGYYGSGMQGNRAISVQVTVPADAQIWFDGTQTKQTGTLRHFVSPPVAPGRDYAYEVQVKWMKDGKEVSQKRRVTVHAGDSIDLAFSDRSRGSEGASSRGRD
jgi:uncharacterized protein (TIGR03000 family)